FLMGPPFSFSVEGPRDYLTLVAFLGVAVLTGELAGRARERASEAEARLREISMLHRLSAAVAEEVDTRKVLPALADQASAICGGAPSALVQEGAGGERVVASRNWPSASDVGLALPPKGCQTTLALEVDGSRVGSLRVAVD